VAVGRTYLLPPLSSGGASLVRPWLRFHTPLIEPDMEILGRVLKDFARREEVVISRRRQGDCMKTPPLYPTKAYSLPAVCERYGPLIPTTPRKTFSARRST
jgi:hypothetical protein